MAENRSNAEAETETEKRKKDNTNLDEKDKDDAKAEESEAQSSEPKRKDTGEANDDDSDSEQEAEEGEGRKQLKEPRVCRVFFSSPFRGMEAERELLTKQYFPTLQSVCSAQGVQFIPVDMRWGISHELSTNAKTIEICLREIDRSDVFVGFFGQRYGWHGVDDPDLQANMANAEEKYPWVRACREKSVTELEFLHGHLNDPGRMPAILTFRDKNHDDEKRREAEEANDARRVAAFSSESDLATELMENLKERVKNVEDKALAVHMSYKDPSEGAKLIFDALNKHIEKLMKEISKKEESAQAKKQGHHEAFIETRLGVYVGGNKYIDQIDQHVNSDHAGPAHMVVTGEAGSGKSALLANWLHHKKQETKQLVLYHFVGCAEDTSGRKDIALNLSAQLQNALLSAELKGKRKKLKEKMQKDYSALTAMNFRDLMSKFEELITKVESHFEKLVFVVDGLNKIVQDTISSQLFTWLPKADLLISKGHKVIVATLNSDEVHLQAIKDTAQAAQLNIEPLDVQDRTEMCVNVLNQRGKVLSQKQLDRVCSAQKTENPLFLKIVLEELCAFGSFRQLDGKIDSLIACTDVAQLFQEVLVRLEEDYNTNEFEGNLVEQTLCSLCVSRMGLKEDDMITMLKMESHVWSPLYFALEQYISVQSGLLGFVYSEMKDALQARYMGTDEKQRHFAVKIVNYVLEQLQVFRIRNQRKFPKYWSSTVPWMCQKYGLKAHLIKALTNLRMSEDLLDDAFWELINYWNYLECKGPEIVHLYTKYGIDAEISQLYQEYLDSAISAKRLVTESIRINYNLVILINDRFKYMKAGLRPLHRAKRILDTTQHLPKTDSKYIEWYMDIGNQLACAYGDMSMYEKSLYFHQDVANFCKAQKQMTSVTTQYAMSVHGIGLACMKQEKYKQAEAMFKMSVALTEKQTSPDKTRKIGQAYTNMGLMYWQQGRLDEAIEYTEKSIELYKEYHFGKDHIDIAYAYTNLGIFYRKKHRLDDAEVVYKKSMDIKLKQLGDQHYDIAVGYVNLQNLALQRKQYKEGLEYARKAWDIYVAIDAADLIPAMQCFENIALLLMKCDLWTEAEEKYWVCYDWLTKPDGLGLNKGLPFVHKQMVLYFYRHKQMDKLRKILPHIMQSRFLMPIHYAILARCDGLTANASRPKELTLQHGIEKHPLKQELRRPLFEETLIPSRDIERVKTELNKFFDVCKEHNPDDIAAEALDLAIYVTYLWEEEGFQEGVKALEQWLTDKFPPEDDFTLKDTLKEVAEDLFKGIGPTAAEDEKVITYARRRISLFSDAKDNYSLVKLLIEATFKLKSVEEARRKWQKFRETCDEETVKKIDDLLTNHDTPASSEE